MSSILDTIVQSKRREVAAQRVAVPAAELESRLSAAAPVRDFRAALEAASGVAVIAEVKKASPSAGVLRADFDPVAIARIYAGAGASAISVLTDSEFFQGHLAYLTAVRQAVSPPVLRKDFIIDHYQVLEARAAGADAVLLIAEILEQAELMSLLDEVKRHRMQALVELYEPENLTRVVDSGARLIGVNNRNLRTFETRLEHTLELATRVPRDRCLVSESGIKNHDDVARLKAAGVKAVLIGETFMRAGDIASKLREIRGVQSVLT